MNVFASALKIRKSSFQVSWKLETDWKLERNEINKLRPISVSSWKLDLETWKLKIPYSFQCVVGEFQFPVFLLPLKGLGVVASGYAWPTPPLCRRAPPNNPSQKPGGDASRQERHRHPHHTASNGEAIWIKRV